MNCKGLIFKLNKSSFWSNDRLVFKQEFYLMKSLSCNNCPKCDYIKEQLKIDISEHNDPWLGSREIAFGTLFEGFLHDEYEAGLRPVKMEERKTIYNTLPGHGFAGHACNADCVVIYK